MTDGRNYLMVAALDFGTTYSGYACSFRHEFKTDPLKIRANPVWKSGSGQFMSLKTSTSLLLTKEQELHAFGFDAENLYAEKILDKEQDDYYYFHRFKMDLHNNKNITGDMVLEDITGANTLPAFVIFKLSIKALVDHLNNEIKKQGVDCKPDEIQWVLTVPAIWTDVAKEFMRKSAQEAGIKRDKLILALEPETASIYCQYLSIEKSKGSAPGFTMPKQGTEYMVVDLGGGTADITVHRKVDNDQLEEKHRAVGNDCGGTSVDKKFLKIIEEIVGKSVLETVKQHDPIAFLDLMREFESVKRTVNTAEKDKELKRKKVNMTIPLTSLNKKCKGNDLESLVDSSKYKDHIQIINDKMRINGDFMRKMFEPTIQNIIALMENTLSKPETKRVSHILLVGGFSDCNLVQEAIQKAFPQKRVIIPEDAGMTVLKGAVLFGHRPSYIRSRVMKCSYGLMTNLPWDERKYPAKYKVEMGDEYRCDKVFSLIVPCEKAVEAGERVKKSLYTPHPNQTEMIFHVYTTENFNPCYVDEPGCSLLCNPKITFPNVCPERRWVDVEFIFGNTEIGLRATDRDSGHVLTTEMKLF